MKNCNLPDIDRTLKHVLHQRLDRDGHHAGAAELAIRHRDVDRVHPRRQATPSLERALAWVHGELRRGRYRELQLVVGVEVRGGHVTQLPALPLALVHSHPDPQREHFWWMFGRFHDL